MIQVDSKLPLPRMLINSGLFNYSSLKPWHLEPVTTVAEGERPRVRQIVPRPRFCACVCVCSQTDYVGVRSDLPPRRSRTSRAHTPSLPSAKAESTTAGTSNRGRDEVFSEKQTRRARATRTYGRLATSRALVWGGCDLTLTSRPRSQTYRWAPCWRCAARRSPTAGCGSSPAAARPGVWTSPERETPAQLARIYPPVSYHVSWAATTWLRWLCEMLLLRGSVFLPAQSRTFQTPSTSGC